MKIAAIALHILALLLLIPCLALPVANAGWLDGTFPVPGILAALWAFLDFLGHLLSFSERPSLHTLTALLLQGSWGWALLAVAFSPFLIFFSPRHPLALALHFLLILCAIASLLVAPIHTHLTYQSTLPLAFPLLTAGLITQSLALIAKSLHNLHRLLHRKPSASPPAFEVSPTLAVAPKHLKA